jgi:predicted RNA binding protein YcfA (HicA-like mRNA interferase family)
MPKTPRDLSHDRLVRFLQRNGWVVAREGGRHTIMTKGPRELSVPRHSVLKTGTVSAVLKQAGIEREALDDL